MKNEHAKDRWVWAAIVDHGPAGEHFWVVPYADRWPLFCWLDSLGHQPRYHWDDVAVGPNDTAAGLLEFLLLEGVYGVSHNRMMNQLATIPAFAKVMKGFDQHSLVSNPAVNMANRTAAYDKQAAEELRRTIQATLNETEEVG